MSQPSIEISSAYIPALPNTGFEPLSASILAFTAVVLIAAGVFVYPYVRKAFISISG